MADLAFMMSEEEKRELTGVVTVMRNLGMMRLSYGDWEIELGPPPIPLSTAEPEKPPPEIKCSCGHLIEEHSEAGCLRGCPIERCGPPQREEPEP